MQGAVTVGMIAVFSFLYLAFQTQMAFEGHAINGEQMFVAGAVFIGSVLLAVVLISRG